MRLSFAVLAVFFALTLRAQEPVRFAFITDNHYSAGSRSVEDFRRCLRDIDSRSDLDFLVLGGDITDFGSDEEIAAVKEMLDSLHLRYYVVPGNHDAKWSESGCNTFREVFGYEQFEFEEKGWRFLGSSCGPDMRMAPALLPQESMEWLRGLESGKKSIFINHYPQDTSVLNYFDVTRELKRAGVQFEIGGHWHQNRSLNYEGIPAVLGRSSMADKVRPAGYNIFTVFEDSVSVAERRLYPHSTVLMSPWYSRRLAPVRDTVTYDADGLPSDYPWMRYDVNQKYPFVRELWKIRESSNIVAGFALDGSRAYYTTASGWVKAISLKDGSEIWARQFPGKIFSTPALEGKYLVFGCTDGNVYCLNPCSGKVRWSFKTLKSIVASPVIFGGKVFMGSSDGVFRALSLKKGKLVWSFDKVEGFVECKPFVDKSQVVFGTWANRLYSLDTSTGALQWVWQCSKPSRMYSPAAVWPVKSYGKIFIAVPDRSMYAIDAATGEQLSEHPMCARESIGLSLDGKTVYTKSMWHRLFAFDVASGVSQGRSGDAGAGTDVSLKWSGDAGAGAGTGVSLRRSGDTGAGTGVSLKWSGDAGAGAGVPQGRSGDVGAGTGVSLRRSGDAGAGTGVSQGRSGDAGADTGVSQGRSGDAGAGTDVSLKWSGDAGAGTDVSQGRSGDAVAGTDVSLKWSVDTGAGYEIGPTPILETASGVVLYPTDKGNLLAFSASDGSLLWAHKISIALVNPLSVVQSTRASSRGSSETSSKTRLLASTMDGVITLLEF